MLHLVADWTTAGPYKSLTWLTVVFTVGVVVTLVLTLIALNDAWSTYKAVRKEPRTTEGMVLLAESTLLRSAGRVLIQIGFLILACVSVYISVTEHNGDYYWYRVTFIVTFLGAELILCLSAVNDLVAKYRIEEYFKERESSE
jgi:hypothetical protein